MNKRKFIKLNIGILTATLLSLGGISSVVVAKNKPIYEKHVFRTPVCGVTNFHTSYSGKTHKITFSGTASGFRDLVIKYDGKIVKEFKLKKADKHFKTTIPFKGYKTFKIYGGNQLLKTISAKKYATSGPTLNIVKRNKDSVYIDFYTTPGNIIKIWEKGQPIYTTITDIQKDNISLDNNKFNNYNDLRITQHKRGKKTSKMVALPKLEVGDVYRRVK
ncbi:hypothetical protein [Lactobacillus sp. B4007]|uniref:hypothetical protein n=1 Tax=Lactobacillus sp. B4007 TaxID=2818032 RepID=UPI00226A5DE1|nr:hypothetical protein [Lactobacillus sp. B4007]MCX8725028.1 hypothetical protein [Lactobacillus sp. B4007]